MPGIIQEIREKINSFLGNEGFFTASLLILVAVTAFGLGRHSITEDRVTSSPVAKKLEIAPTAAANETLPSTFYVASKNGQVYHLPHCSGAKNISEANKITFNTKAEAEAAGYRPAANCKGI